ncbi:hypothetical protein [Chromobacterium piscinae]|uniref:hypothetical protein n=1 Tax=Chromobacterium piscinae TaxID=686831 RepID=UPI003207CC0F
MRLYLSPDRYYAIAIQLDLFDRPVIVRAWGGRGNRRGGMATEPFSTARLKDIDRRRRQHGYQLHRPN